VLRLRTGALQLISSAFYVIILYGTRQDSMLASLAPTYLTTDTHLVSEYGRRPLRSSTDRTLTVPRTHNKFGDRSFAVAGPRLWNSLPISLRQISSYDSLGDIWKIIYLGFEKSQRSVTHDSLRYINILPYLLTYLQPSKWLTVASLVCKQPHPWQSKLLKSLSLPSK